MNVKTIAIEMPAGERLAPWAGPFALVFGCASWVIASVQLFAGAQTASAEAVVAARPSDAGPGTPQVPAASAPVPLPVASPSRARAPADAQQTDRAPVPAHGDAKAASCAPVAVVAFPTGRPEIDEPTGVALGEVVAFASDHPAAAIAIEGFASAEGGPEANLRVSHARARVVAGLLAARGIVEDRLVVQAYGEYRPSVRGRGSREDRRVVVRFPEQVACEKEAEP